MDSESKSTVWCNQCKTPLDEEPSLPGPQRKPCPTCGSLTRQVNITLTASLTPAVLDAANASVLRPDPLEVRRSIEASQADMVMQICIMKLPDGGFLAEVSDGEGGEIGLVGQLDWQDVVLGIALYIEGLRRP